MSDHKPAAPTPEEALASFATAIDSYEHRVGHACRAVAGHIVNKLPPLAPDAIILDNACGTGAVTDKLTQIQSQHRQSIQIYASDAIPGMIAAFEAIRATTPAWQSTVVDASVMDAQSLTYQDNFFDLHFMNFAVQFLQDPAKAMTEAYRTLKPAGTFIVTAWKVIGFKPVLWEVQKRIRPVRPLSELPVVDRWTDGLLLRQVIEQAGFAEVEFRTVDEFLLGTDLGDLLNVLVENIQSMVARDWTDVEKAQVATVAAMALGDSEDKFCVRRGGKIGVPMNAWVVTCKKP